VQCGVEQCTFPYSHRIEFGATFMRSVSMLCSLIILEVLGDITVLFLGTLDTTGPLQICLVLKFIKKII